MFKTHTTGHSFWLSRLELWVWRKEFRGPLFNREEWGIDTDHGIALITPLFYLKLW